MFQVVKEQVLSRLNLKTFAAPEQTLQPGQESELNFKFHDEVNVRNYSMMLSDTLLKWRKAMCRNYCLIQASKLIFKQKKNFHNSLKSFCILNSRALIAIKGIKRRKLI